MSSCRSPVSASSWARGGMGPNTERACKEFGAIHCVFPAGNAVVAATEVEEIVEAQWRDLGMPETLWHCHVNEFGPLIVSIDAEGPATCSKRTRSSSISARIRPSKRSASTSALLSNPDILSAGDRLHSLFPFIRFS